MIAIKPEPHSMYVYISILSKHDFSRCSFVHSFYGVTLRHNANNYARARVRVALLYHRLEVEQPGQDRLDKAQPGPDRGDPG